MRERGCDRGSYDETGPIELISSQVKPKASKWCSVSIHGVKCFKSLYNDGSWLEARIATVLSPGDH